MVPIITVSTCCGSAVDAAAITRKKKERETQPWWESRAWERRFAGTKKMQIDFTNVC